MSRTFGLYRAGSVICRSVLLSVIAIASAVPEISAQQRSGGIVGSVRDEKLRPLAGAEVSVIGAANTAAADRDGAFRLLEVAPGSRRVVARYIGYQPETLSVVVESGHFARADMRMHQPVQSLEAIRVESSVAGQAAALNQQLAADNFSSVVDAELVGRLPDRNLAEALGRVPGVALVRDQGEGRFVQIRGTNATLNTLSIDGMRLPSPDPTTRQTPMDVIPSDMVAAIQVSKTLTPDMDGDAIGGNVNLVTPSPRSGMPIAIVNVAGGENRINSGQLRNAAISLGRRLHDDKLGILVGGSYYQNDRGSQNYEMGWCVETACKGVPAASALDAPTQIALRDYSQVLRIRKGANATLDYKFDDRNSLFLKGFYSRFSDAEERYVTTPGFSSGTYVLTDANHGMITGGREDKEVRLRPVAQSQSAVQLGGKNLIGTGLQLDYAAQVAQAREDRPQTLTMVWRQSAMDFAYDVSDQNQPKFSVTKGADLDATKYLFNTLRQQTRHALDDDRSGKFDLSQQFSIGAVTGTFKFGGAARLKDRTSRDTSNRFLNTFKTGAPTPGLPVTLASLQGASRSGHFLNDVYAFGPQASSAAVTNFWNTYGSSLNINAAQSAVETNSGSYDIAEDVYAGYAMATVDIGALRLITGARLEHTAQDIKGNLVKQSGTAVTILPQESTPNYSNVLPSVTAKYSVSERTILRGAITTSLVRPNFSDLPPFTNIPDGTGVTATQGNAALKPIRSVNFDAMVEHYFRSVGFVSGGVFHKNLTDYIFVAQRVATSADGLGTTVANIAQPQNAESGSLTGVELAWQQNLTMLPGFLRGLGFNMNYTGTTSSTSLPSRAGTTARLPGQAGNAANVGLFYESGRFQLKSGYNFSDKYLEVVGATEQNDIYVASRGQLDFSGSFQVTQQSKVFFETNNLTNQPLRRYEGRSERSWQPGNEYYRSWGMVGVRIEQ